jgi:hypothetical protein
MPLLHSGSISQAIVLEFGIRGHGTTGKNKQDLSFHVQGARLFPVRPTAKGKMMMKALFVVAAVLFSAEASAQFSTQYPFCIQGTDYPGWNYCTFTSYQQCQASASGTDSECLANPWYSAGGGGAPPPGGSAIGLNAPIIVAPPPEN